MAKIQREYVGIGEISKLPAIIAEYKAQRVFLVTGKSSYVESGAKQWVDGIQDVAWQHFDKIGSLPLQEDIDKGIAAYEAFAPDLVVAIGGGSVIDVAKAINHSTGRKPLLAVPTTAGAGSEATHFAVVYKDGVKHSLSDESILPDVCIVDPALTFSVPKMIAAASALDALAQSIESYWSTQATEESRKLSLEALAILWPNIEKAVVDHDEQAMIEVSRGAHLAGKAINIAKTTACHALSYGLTYRFRVPHGIAVALLLPPVMRFNNVALPHGITDASIKDLFDRLDIMDLGSYGVRETDIPSLSEEVNQERLSNNPRPLSRADIESFYKEII